MKQKFTSLGFGPADILLPQADYMKTWAVVACDQFTSQPDYWEEAARLAGNGPSALRVVLPEVYLNAPDVGERIAAINGTMESYLARGVFRELPESLVYVERTQSDGRVRHGLVGCIDLEQYDFTPDTHTLIRATEGTVLERIPPRVRVREQAALELPHVMLLLDDPRETVLGPLTRMRETMETLYDTELMLRGGHIKGWRLSEAQMEGVAAALLELKQQIQGEAPLLFAVGDGNHSLAAAKACYEHLKQTTPKAQWDDLPARYALVEVVNLHDTALTFEPIHRVLFHVNEAEVRSAFQAFYPAAYIGKGMGHTLKVCWSKGAEEWTVPHPDTQLAAGTLQSFLDDFLKHHPETQIDYIHGDDVAQRLGCQMGNAAFLLPSMEKAQLFPTVVRDGVLPRKTFSMGEAQDKRYYLEARKIR